MTPRRLQHHFGNVFTATLPAQHGPASMMKGMQWLPVMKLVIILPCVSTNQTFGRKCGCMGKYVVGVQPPARAFTRALEANLISNSISTYSHHERSFPNRPQTNARKRFHRTLAESMRSLMSMNGVPYLFSTFCLAVFVPVRPYSFSMWPTVTFRTTVWDGIQL